MEVDHSIRQMAPISIVAADLDRQQRAPNSTRAAARRRSTALSSKREQCHDDG